MKRIVLSLALLLSLLLPLALPASAYTRLSYGADHLAASASLRKSGEKGEPIRFSEVDFKQALGLSRIDTVTLLSLPDASAGVLKVGDRAAVAGEILPRESLSSLALYPASAAVESATFRFCVDQTRATTALECSLQWIECVNYGPTVQELDARSLAVSTQAGITVFGTMHAQDPEGDALRYLIVSYPTKGYLRVSEETGEYRYTPLSGKSGSDSFSYVAQDTYGNYSEVATVQVQVKARTDTLVYADMRGHAAHSAALTLTEAGVMIGTISGDDYLFSPDGTISRADFLVMAMKSAGCTPAQGMERTWFDDDDAIADAVRPYVATAQLYGYVNGTFDGAGLYFQPDQAITRAEAAMVLSRLLSLPLADAVPAAVTDSAAIPVWARSAVYALYDAGLLPLVGADQGAATAPLTRADAALLLCAVRER